MRLAICGTDNKAFKVKLLLDLLNDCNITTEMFIGPAESEIDDTSIKTITVDELLSNDYSDCIDGFVIPPEYYGLTRLNIYKKLKSSTYSNKQIYMPDFFALCDRGVFDLVCVESVLVPYEDSAQLFYLEVHAADHCNLNCKGCMHFSSLVKKNTFPDFDRLQKDIMQLRKFINHIDIIRILGGEPLLNPDLAMYIRLLRDSFPYANINIVTNGLLIEKMTDELCNTIRDNKVHVHVSLYPPVKHKKIAIESFLKENRIVFEISECINTFTSTYQSKPLADKRIAKEQCEIFCNNLRDGKMSCCPHIIYTHYYNDYFGADYPVEDGLIDIYQIESARELHQRLSKPTSLCAYCDRSVCFDWGTTKGLYSEWLATERTSKETINK